MEHIFKAFTIPLILPLRITHSHTSKKNDDLQSVQVNSPGNGSTITEWGSDFFLTLHAYIHVFLFSSFFNLVGWYCIRPWSDFYKKYLKEFNLIQGGIKVCLNDRLTCSAAVISIEKVPFSPTFIRYKRHVYCDRIFLFIWLKWWNSGIKLLN